MPPHCGAGGGGAGDPNDGAFPNEGPALTFGDEETGGGGGGGGGAAFGAGGGGGGGGGGAGDEGERLQARTACAGRRD